MNSRLLTTTVCYSRCIQTWSASRALHRVLHPAVHPQLCLRGESRLPEIVAAQMYSPARRAAVRVPAIPFALQIVSGMALAWHGEMGITCTTCSTHVSQAHLNMNYPGSFYTVLNPLHTCSTWWWCQWVVCCLRLLCVVTGAGDIIWRGSGCGGRQPSGFHVPGSVGVLPPWPRMRWGSLGAYITRAKPEWPVHYSTAGATDKHANAPMHARLEMATLVEFRILAGRARAPALTAEYGVNRNGAQAAIGHSTPAPVPRNTRVDLVSYLRQPDCLFVPQGQSREGRQHGKSLQAAQEQELPV